MKSIHFVITISLVLLLAISIGANLLTFQYAQSYYHALHDARLDPKGMRYFTNEPTPIEDEIPRVVFFGDSRAAQWFAPFANFQFINRGIGAQTSTQVALRYRDHVTPLEPDILILQVGINDLKTIPIFPERQREIIEQCKANIKRMVDQALADDTTVILTTIFPIGTVPLIRQPFWSPEVGLAVQEVNDYLATLQGPNVLLMDSYEILSEDDITKEQYEFDTLHLNVAGYNELNRHLLQILDQAAS